MLKAVLEHKNKGRMHILMQGTLQGVGFRPFVYRLAKKMFLGGYVCNSSEGVSIEVEGDIDQIHHFINQLKTKLPIHAHIDQIKINNLPIQNESRFIIRDSHIDVRPTAIILPDIATCPQCLNDIFDPSNRRYLYPFTNCTHCGPRFSIIRQLPYDRVNTTMASFTMCDDCRREYLSPDDRRFHAQPNACPKCGPQLEAWDAQGRTITHKHEAVLLAVSALREGKIVALKGLGGFQLMVDATNSTAVSLLRQRKHREEKPFAVMFPSMDMINQYCHVSFEEKRILTSAQSPITLIAKKENPAGVKPLAPEIALGNPYLGVMCAYTPLHWILMKEMGSAVVATSANFSQEPMCFDNQDALNKLGGIADIFLVHDRPIERPVDDSIVLMIKDKPSITRRARGYAPLPVTVDGSMANVLALGAQMKNTVALKVRNKVYISQHIGDLQSPESFTSFVQSIQSLRGLYTQPVDRVAIDSHPDYLSTRYAQALNEPSMNIQHHHAHIVSCMAEHQLHGPVLGIAWDGTGYGDDQTIWGGEFLLSTRDQYTRVGSLRPFSIPGSESSIRQPKRTALGLLTQLCDGKFEQLGKLKLFTTFKPGEIENISTMLSKGIQSPQTTSMGRLFDGISALLGLCHEASYEAQAAMNLEFCVDRHGEHLGYPVKLYFDDHGKLIYDWRPLIQEILNDLNRNIQPGIISTKVHLTFVDMGIKMAKHFKLHQVVLSGGCFQNRFLLEHMIDQLRKNGFDPFWHVNIPTNDGGISLGQAVIAASKFKS